MRRLTPDHTPPCLPRAALPPRSLARPASYVDVPKTVHAYSEGARVIVTEWVYGRHLEKLDRAEGLRMTYMAVEAYAAPRREPARAAFSCGARV